MHVLFDNCDFESSSGPNRFGLHLAKRLSLMGHTLADPPDADVQLSFIMTKIKCKKPVPVVLRLDGIYFNSAQDWQEMNIPLARSYVNARAVIAQTEFDRELIKSYFGEHEWLHAVIRNGTDLEAIEAIGPADIPQLDSFKRVWVCASQWRPHKRLADDIRCFMELGDSNDCLVIAGADPDTRVSDPRVFYAGHMQWDALIALFKRADVFVHLPWLGHCDNVLIDARACGCDIICTSSGGTPEIAGKGAMIIEDREWDFEPIELYNPPALDFSKSHVAGLEAESDIDITNVAKEYESVLNIAIENYP